MFIRLSKTFCAVIALLGASPAAFAATIDFSDLGSAPFNTVNFGTVSQAFGDSAEADVSYATLDGGENWGQNATVFDSTVRYWAPAEYSGDQAIFAANDNKKIEVKLDAGAGLKFSSITFDFGAWPNTNQNTSYKLFDDTWTQIGGGDGLLVNGLTGALLPFALNTASVVFQFGNDWDVGLKSISYSTVADASDVPLPGALLFGLTGLLGLASTGRMKNRRV